MGSSVTNVLRDPEFLALPREERRKVLLRMDPEFAVLPTNEQWRAIDAMAMRSQVITPPELGQVALKTGRGLLDIIASEGPPALGAVAGGMLGAPAGPPGIIGGAALGAAGTEAAAQLLRRGIGLPPVPAGSTIVAPETPAGRIAEQGLLGGMQEAGTAARTLLPTVRNLPKSLTTREAQLGREFNVPLTRTQRLQLGAPMGVAVEPVLRRSLFGYPIYRKFDEKVKQRLVTAARDLMNSIAPVGRGQRGYGQMLKSAMEQYRIDAGTLYDDALSTIEQAGARQVPVDTQRLAQDAQGLLHQIELTGDYAEVLTRGGADAESLNFAIQRLRMLAEPEKVVPGQFRVTQMGQTVPLTEPKELDWEQARRLRTILFDLSNRGESTIGKGAIKKFNESLNREMGTALDTAGRADLKALFENASTNYREMNKALENQIVAQIIKTDKPGTIIRSLFQGDPESAVDILTRIAPQKREELARAFFQEAWKRSTREGVPVANGFERVWADLPKGAKMRLFGSRTDLLDRVERFAELIDTVGLGPSLARKPASLGPSLMAMGGSNILVGGALGLAFNPSLQGVAQGVGAGLLIPGVLAYLNPPWRNAEVLALALRTPAVSSAAPQIASRLARIIANIPTRDMDDLKAQAEFDAPWGIVPPPAELPTITGPPPAPR